jgi:hypothetical protein
MAEIWKMILKGVGCMTVEKIKGKVWVTIDGVTKNITQWAREYGLSEKTLGQRLHNGWDEEHLFDPPGLWKPTSCFNEHFFDMIDNEKKAYWLGFIWCDGYMAIRNRKNRNSTSYEFKLTLKEEDDGHLEKFNQDLGGSYKINYYNMSSGFVSGRKEARLLITNQHFGKTLVEKYGLVPHRTDCSKIIQSIPEHLMQHFIRGVVEADGTFCKYRITEKGYGVDKYRVSIGTNEDILRTIEKHLMDKNIINVSERKLYQRHEGADGEYRTLEISGKTQCLNILNYIYEDANVYLDRKYDRYLSIIGKSEVLSNAV